MGKPPCCQQSVYLSYVFRPFWGIMKEFCVYDNAFSNKTRYQIQKHRKFITQSMFQYISNKMQLYTVYLYLETALHVSGDTSTHHQERIQLYLQHLVFVRPLLIPAAIAAGSSNRYVHPSLLWKNILHFPQKYIINNNCNFNLTILAYLFNMF